MDFVYAISLHFQEVPYKVVATNAGGTVWEFD